MDLKNITNEYKDKEIKLSGWIKNHRKQASFGFISLNDGTRHKPLQVVYDNNLINFEEVNKYNLSSAIEVEGVLKESQGGKQDLELVASKITLLGSSTEDYPLQPKKHSLEYLRTIAHLRPRTNLFNAIFKIRSLASFAIHEYFSNNNYVYVHTPLITTADCEGSDQMFKLTTLNMNDLPMKDKQVDMTKDIFKRQAYITGSGQLHGETFAHGFKKIYTFGPTFRSENSNTKTHANEFWMIEPEICFCDLDELMNIEEDMLKYIVKYVLENAKDELEFLQGYNKDNLIEKLSKILDVPFIRIDHKEAIDLLNKSSNDWEFKPSYEEDIAKEHERYLTEYYNSPVFVKNWPKDIKAYYMKLNEDNKTVAAVDLIVPGSGELMGGSQREENLEVLKERMAAFGIDSNEINWYLDLRKYGTTIHSGFGMGFERLIMYLTGVENIRDVIPYPRTPGNCDF